MSTVMCDIWHQAMQNVSFDLLINYTVKVALLNNYLDFIGHIVKYQISN